MGRGRAKAKQTKVARELKYRSVDTDFTSLERELRGDEGGPQIPSAYADLVEDGEAGETGHRESGNYQDLRKSG